MYQQMQRESSSAPAGPIHDETFPFKAAALEKFPVKAAVDRGSGLVKIVFVPKSAPDDAEIVPLRCVSFANDKFDDALRFLKAEAKLPAEGQLHYTGMGAAAHRGRIKEIVGLDVLFINEMVAMGYGPFLLVSNVDPNEILFPVPKFRTWEGESTMTKDIMETLEKGVTVTDDLFPALVVCVGSGCAVMAVDKEGVSTLTGSVGLSGEPFLGLAHVLLGTADYDQIIDLAEKGDPSKADSTVADVLQDDPDSPYGHYPPDMPAIPFGKAAYKAWSARDMTKPDLAASLVGLTAFGLSLSLFTCISTTGISKVYLAGNFFRRELVQRVMHEKMHNLMEQVPFTMRTLRTGCGGAVAAMLTNTEDEARLMKF